MEKVVSIQPLIPVLISLLAIPIIIYIGERDPNKRETVSVIAGILKFIAVLSMYPAVSSGKQLELTLFTILPGVELKFMADRLSLLFAMGASFLWILTTFYSIGYMRSTHEKNQTRFFACFAGALSTTMGVAFSANLFTIFLFYEALSIITYPLVAHKGLPESKHGARKYAIYLLAAAKLFLVLALIMTYNLAGTLEFTKGGIFTQEIVDKHTGILKVMFFMYLYGFAKNAVMPLHGWLPAAMVAPTPVSALLHAVAVVKTGVYCVYRYVMYTYGVNTINYLGLDNMGIFLASFTIVMASVIALSRDNLKARLAYSTISQLSYIVLGSMLLTTSGLMGGLLHITNHAFAKITLFFCAGSIYCSAHLTEISQLNGIGRKMPWTMAAFTIGALGMIGVPGVGCFATKWYLMQGALERDSLIIFAVLVASTLLNTAYFMPIVYKAFFEKESHDSHSNHGHGHGHDDHHHDHGEIKENPFMVIPLTITAIISVILGLFPDSLIELIKSIVVD